MQRVQNTVSKVGYSDGITAGRESVFQKGFDIGYENGLATGFQLAKYKAFYDVMKSPSPLPENIKNESSIYNDHHLSDATDKSHFRGEDGNEIAQISERQIEYVNSKRNQFAKDLPIATSLFSR